MAQPVYRFNGTSTNGYVGSNDLTSFQVRNFNHAIFKKPVLGWTTYSLSGGFSCTESNITNAISRMLATGADKLGYNLIMVDAGWTKQTNDPPLRDVSGNLLINPTNFPSGLAGLRNIAHTNGFKIVMYLATGARAGNLYTGSKDYWFQDTTNLMMMGFDGLRVMRDDDVWDDSEFTDGGSTPNLQFARYVMHPLQNFSKPYHLNIGTFNLHAWMQGAVNEITLGTYHPPLGDGTHFFDADGSQTNSVNYMDFFIPRSGMTQPGTYFSMALTGIGNQSPGFTFNTAANQRCFGVSAMIPLSIYAHDFDYDAAYKGVQTNALMLSVHQDALVSPGLVVSSNGNMISYARLLSPSGSTRRALAYWNRSFVANTSSMSVASSDLGIPNGTYNWTNVWSGTGFSNTTNAYRVTLTNDQFDMYIISP